MDESLRIPYYFPPQRYIPRLGGGRESPENPASGFLGGVKDAVELYMQLQQAKQGRDEREADRRERMKAQEDTQNYRNRELALHGEENLGRARATQAQRELAEQDYAQKSGIVLNPGIVRQRMEEPTQQNIPAIGPVSGVGMPIGPPRQEAGLSEAFEHGAKARVTAEQTRTPQQFAEGIALPSPASERYDYRASEDATRLLEARIRAATSTLDNWESGRLRYAEQKIAEFRAQNKFPVPGQENEIVDRAMRDYATLRPKPRFSDDLKPYLPQDEQGKTTDQDAALDAAIAEGLKSGALRMRKKGS